MLAADRANKRAAGGDWKAGEVREAHWVAGKVAGRAKRMKPRVLPPIVLCRLKLEYGVVEIASEVEVRKMAS